MSLEKKREIAKFMESESICGISYDGNIISWVYTDENPETGELYEDYMLA